MEVKRYDAVDLKPSHTTPEGFVFGEAIASRVGVFPYRNADGTTRWELRPPEEVFHPDSLASLARKPLTNMHPDAPVGPANAKFHMIGLLGEQVTEDQAGGFVRVTYTLTHKDGIDAARSGRKALSPGYSVTIDHTPGTFNGQHYDAVQRNIRYNHVALVDIPRQAGLTLRLDANDAIQMDPSDGVTTAPNQRADNRSNTMVKLTLGRVSYEVEEGLASQVTSLLDRQDALEQQLSKVTADKLHVDEQLGTLQGERDAQKVRADKAEEALAQRQDFAPSEQQMQAWYQERQRVEAVAKSFKLDSAGKTNAQLKAAVVDAYLGNTDQRTDAIVDGAFSVLAKTLENATQNNQDTASALLNANGGGSAYKTRMDAAEKAYMQQLKGGA